ncbi:hypothetical protein H310_03140 [Aphanomyces invadans]|uniref:Uncharacterized protein n=1 Tax=Aphanomyces invadans TaxID=157072 RepID=A0A024UN73_9STRA|nr:hypothetical protein H310_03140 [Aphanomyces invadans]ETW07068.1 hypothetical protein H310_03140 [Aphanomyces invadans]|eukprot:XP_008865143.1 hypothetical protein H310_03140 [Aphanomyces invadans]
MIATVGSGAGGAAAPGFQYKHLQANESIQAFLRSFLHEKHRWNELVEATLLYGIHCISQNYSLQTLNVDQVQHITRVSCEQQFCLHDFLDLGTLLRKPQHYFVHQQRLKGPATSSGVAFKPSSVWRHGTSTVDAVSSDGDTEQPTPPPTQELHSIPSAPPAAPIVRESHRDMDEWTHVLGKPWVDAAWQAFVTTTGYPVPAATASDSTVSASFRDLRDSIVAKAPSTGVVNTHITSNEGHLSFLDYLRGFVVYCVATPVALPPAAPLPSSLPPPSAASKQSSSQSQPRRQVSTTKENAPPSLAAAPSTQPMSKIKHMLDKQKQHVLRVRKTNTQRMHEALAKSRIAAYEPPVRRPAIPPPQPSLATTGPGAKALEIAHVFASSPFMQSLSEGQAVDVASNASRHGSNGGDIAHQRLLRAELYGHHNVDPSTLPATGCLTPSDRRPSGTGLPLRQQRPFHDFKGWLGDYGPSHTKTVVPAEWTDLDDEDTAWLRDAAAATRRRGGYSWDLDRIQLDEKRSTAEPVQPFHADGSDDVDEEDGKEARRLDGGADAPDPAFEWLVHEGSSGRVAEPRDDIESN